MKKRADKWMFGEGTGISRGLGQSSSTKVKTSAKTIEQHESAKIMLRISTKSSWNYKNNIRWPADY